MTYVENFRTGIAEPWDGSFQSWCDLDHYGPGTCSTECAVEKHGGLSTVKQLGDAPHSDTTSPEQN